MMHDEARWIPLEESGPTEEDASPQGYIACVNKIGDAELRHFKCMAGITHWMRFPKFPKRERFTRWWAENQELTAVPPMVAARAAWNAAMEAAKREDAP